MRYIRHHEAWYYVADDTEMFNDTKWTMDRIVENMYDEKFLVDMWFIKYECSDQYYNKMHELINKSNSHNRGLAIMVELIKLSQTK